MWVKICANTTLEDARMAANAGADAVGFVFARSPRQVSLQHVREITLRLPPSIEKIGVFGEASFDEIVEAVEGAGLTGVQLHGPQNSTITAKLRFRYRHSQPGLRIFQTLHFHAAPEEYASGSTRPSTPLQPRNRTWVESLQSVGADPSLDALLLDSRTAGASGGTGVAFDWAAARESLLAIDNRLRLIVAGGLNPLNVSEAIRVLSPWGVDVATGVEASPGKKDPAKVKAFVTQARAASTDTLR